MINNESLINDMLQLNFYKVVCTENKILIKFKTDRIKRYDLISFIRNYYKSFNLIVEVTKNKFFQLNNIDDVLNFQKNFLNKNTYFSFNLYVKEL